MCILCDHNKITAKSLDTEDRRILGYIGAVRRGIYHNNKHQTKDHEISESALVAEWKSIDAIKQQQEKPLRRDLRRLFKKQISELVQSLRDKVGVKGFRKMATKPELVPFIVQTLIDWGLWFDRTKETAKGGVQKSVEEGFETGLTRLAVEGPDFTSDKPNVRIVIDEILNQTARTQNTFQKIAAREIQRGLSEGDNMAKIVVRVANKSEEYIGFRLDRIVRTAANGGFEFGQRESFRKSGMSEISWLSQRDSDVRDPVIGSRWSHRGADGQIVGIDDPFIIFGTGGISETLWYPSDPNGSPGNTIYCRCTLRPVS